MDSEAGLTLVGYEEPHWLFSEGTEQSRFTWSGRREAQPLLLLHLRTHNKISATAAMETFLSKEQIWGW